MSLMVDPETVGFTDADWGRDKGRGHRRHAAAPVPAPGGKVTADLVPPDDPAIGDLWFDSATSRAMVWNGVDWLRVTVPGPPAPSPPRPFPRPDPTMPAGSMVLVIDGALSDADGRVPELVDAYRAQMTATAERWAARHGFEIARGSWSTLPPAGPHIAVPLRLECYLVPLTTGVWGEVWEARAQDAADRRGAAPMDPTPTDAPIVVHVDAGPPSAS